MTVIEWLLSDCCASRAALGKKWVSLLRECLQSLATEVKVKHADPCPHTSLFIFLVKGSQSGPDGVRDPHRPSAPPCYCTFDIESRFGGTHTKKSSQMFHFAGFYCKKRFLQLSQRWTGRNCLWLTSIHYQVNNTSFWCSCFWKEKKNPKQTP